MSTTSAGEIGLDLVINQRQYRRQLGGIASMAKKAGAAIAASFAVKKVADFGAKCIELGSDLAEVQNVVDVTFPHMTAQVDAFAKNAATSFGLSETMAKKFTGTFGAMAKAFGFSESAAYEMSSDLTGLAGDVASFYNLSQDEAYTKLKSVFTGETESLKDLGVVMTQSALDAYALANGYGKTTQAMSEMEKVALRYAFVQDQLSAASGDFARTSDSWANQVRILSLQFDSLKATIGQGLINVLTPVVKVINTVIAKVMTLANAFKAFTELLTGKKSGAAQVTEAGAAAEESLGGAAGAADALGGATSGVGKAAKKAAKEMKALMGFDKINKISEEADESGSGGSSGSGSGVSGGAGIDFGSLAEGDTVIDRTDTAIGKLINKAKELAGVFKEGFQIGFGDSERNIESIKQSLSSIGATLKEIFTSEEVTGAADKLAAAVAESLGKMTGAAASVAVAIAANLTGGVAKSLEENKGFIKEKIASIFSIEADIWKVKGDLAAALGEIISSALTSEPAMNISSDICTILTTAVLGGAELFSKIGYDMVSLIAQPIIDNKEKISLAIENTLKPVSTILGTVKTAVQDAFSVARSTYDKYIAPMFEALKIGTSNTLGRLMDVYNTSVAPALQAIADKFEEIYEPHIKPVLEKIGELIGAVADAVKELYLTFLKPLVDWVIETIVPILMPVFEALGKGIVSVFGFIADAVGGVIDVLKGVVEFITGIFTGDWKKAWEGIKDIFSGIVDVIKGIWNGIKAVFKAVIDAIKSIFSPIVGWFKEKCSAIKEVFTNIPAWFKDKFSAAYAKIKNVFSGIGSWFKEKCASIKDKFASIHTWFKDKFSAAYAKIKGVFSGIGSWFKDRCTSIKNKFTNIPTWFKDKFSSSYTRIKNVFSGIGAWFGERWVSIKNKFTNVPAWFKEKFQSAWTKIKNVFSGVGTFFGGIWSTIKAKFTSIGTTIGDAIGGAFKTVINGVLSTVEGTVNRGIGFINGAISAINKIPGVNISKMGTVSLPRLAQGGYVKPNTPQLAVIGDNRHQGEVVAPEDKLREMAMDAVRAAGSSGDYSPQILKVLLQILEILRSMDLNIVIDGKKLKDIIVEKINKNTQSTGVCEILI